MVKKAVFLCVLALSAPLDAGERLAMRVTPNMALEPALLTVRTVIEAEVSEDARCGGAATPSSRGRG